MIRPSPASCSPRRRTSSPRTSSALHTWVSIDLGPIDLSINKAVVYLLVGAARDLHRRHLDHALRALACGRAGKQTTGESLYELVHGQIAEGNLPTKAIALVVPLRRGALPLHLDPQHHRLHPVADLGRALRRRRRRAADVGDLRGDREPERDARARADHILRDALRGHPLQRPRQRTSRAGSRAASPRGAAALHRAARGHLAVHAPDLALRPTLRQHARGPHADPRHDRPDLHLRVARDRRHRRARWRRRSTSSRSRSWSRSRPSSSRSCPPSTSAEQSNRNTRNQKREGMWIFLLLARRRGDVADAGKAIAFGVGVGLGAVGAGIGIGNIFGSMIQAVARQPELRSELDGHPVARLRPHRGGRVLRPPRRPARLRPGLVEHAHGFSGAVVLAQEESSDSGRPDLGRPGPDDLDDHQRSRSSSSCCASSRSDGSRG